MLIDFVATAPGRKDPLWSLKMGFFTTKIRMKKKESANTSPLINTLNSSMEWKLVMSLES